MSKGRGNNHLPRSGLIRWTEAPTRTATTGPEIRAALEALVANSSLETKLKLARREAANAENLALHIYAKHGLPSVNGAYQRRAGGGWEPTSLAAEPGAKWIPVLGADPSLEPKAEVCWLEKVPEQDFPLEAEPRRAAEILSIAGDAFRLLNRAEAAGSWDTVEAFLAGLRLAGAYQTWREEWVLNEYIVPARRAKETARSRGVKGGERRREKADVWKAHALVLALAERHQRPSLSQRNLAAEVQAGWKLDKPEAPGFDSILEFVRIAERDGRLPKRSVE